MNDGTSANLRLLDFIGNEPTLRSTDDVLSLTLPLIEQVVEVHERGQVAPLEGVDDVMVTAGKLWFEKAKARSWRRAEEALGRLQRPESLAFEIESHTKRVHDDDGIQTTELGILEPGDALERPSFLTRYVSWEHELGHHDPLTDIYVLGLVLASVAFDVNLGEREELERFVNRRTNLVSLNQRLHPVVSRVIARMTEVDRRRRAQDLQSILTTLRNYREQVLLDDDGPPVLAGVGPIDMRRRTYTRLRDRLVDFSRRNRLLYFSPSSQTVNLTQGSVPLVLNVQNISPDMLLTWRGRAAKDIASTKAVPLGRYLRFEDFPFLRSSLDQLRLDANRTRTELGFSPLRLAVCFLHWHNLKEDGESRITSPLLLLPVTLEKRKGVRDAILLTAESDRAEVNPVLRQFLQQLYGVKLPEQVDLSDERAIAILCDDLQRQVQASEPGISLSLIEKPRIDMVLAQAKKRLELYRKRVALSGRSARSHLGFDYSYARGKFHPLGVQMFTHLVYPSAAPNRELHEEPRPRIFGHSAGMLEKSLYSLKDGGTVGGPYEWAIDLCSVTLANFNYRKMSLVRDYTALLDSSTPHASFNALFSTDTRPILGEPPVIPIEERFDVMPADPTQAGAVARARRGDSCIIQGPPGTGKSQTITNLIADYVSRGKRVLFVCEKRAAIDVVFHRLRMQGLAPLTCLIHDSQTDKRAFIKDLKETYEAWIARAPEQILDDTRRRSAASYGAVIGRASRFRAAMHTCPAGSDLPIVSLLARALDLVDLPSSGVPPERLPSHRQFAAGAAIARSVEQGLRAIGRDASLSRHPLRVLGDELLSTDNPSSTARDEARAVRGLLDAVLASELAHAADITNISRLTANIRLVGHLRPLIDQNALPLLDRKSDLRRGLERALAVISERTSIARKAAESAVGWRTPIPSAEVSTALALARRFEGSILYRVFGWLSPGWWRLRGLLRASFDFTSRALRPSWSEILELLQQKHVADASVNDARDQAKLELGLSDLDAIINTITALPADTPDVASVCGWLATPAGQARAAGLLRSADAARELEPRLNRLIRNVGQHEPMALRELIVGLERSIDDLPAFLEPLRNLAKSEHSKLAGLVRDYPVSVEQLERDVCRAEADAGLRERALDMLSGVDWDSLRIDAMATGTELRRTNAEALIERTRNRFLEHVRISNAPTDSLNREQKQLKKLYASGRKELEHEFGKTTRFRSIRDLAGGNTGVVLRELKPVWLMSPLSVADTLPLEGGFDVVIFDEASQIPLEDAVPAAHRGVQTIVVGDQMQLPPTDFFGSGRSDSEEGEPLDVGFELDAQSLLSHAERALPSTMLGWHYRSRDEALIAFSNRAFYDGRLLTVPSALRSEPRLPIVGRDARDGKAGAEALLERTISYHRIEYSPYDQRRNDGEARYIAELVRGLLARETGKTIGIVAFSEAQQSQIEMALRDLAADDHDFGARYESETEREEDGQHVGLFVKNLENVQGDERDIVIISVCYGPDVTGRMLMNFGPINKSGGEKRLNVIFSRAKSHLAVVSSIQFGAITNQYNDGANCLRNYLRYAEAMSVGNRVEADLALQGYSRRDYGVETRGGSSFDERLARALRDRGFEVDLGVGSSQFRCNLGLRRPGETHYRLGILIDDPAHQRRSVDELLHAQPAVLEAFGWQTMTVLHKDWYSDPELVLERIESALQSQ